jgi:Tfp pilus assembly protein PilZ
MAMSLQLEPSRGRELRVGGRVDFHRRAWCEHNDLTLYLLVENLSDGGLFIQTSTPLKLGERLRVCVLDMPSIIVDVEIVWTLQHSRRGGVGCRVISFAQGEDCYSALLARLAENGC